MSLKTEYQDPDLLDLDCRTTQQILTTLIASQQRGVEAVTKASQSIDDAVAVAATCLLAGEGRLVLVGAGASGRLAVQDGAEMWPTYGWPYSRLLLSMAGGEAALLQSIEGVEDDAEDARSCVQDAAICAADVVVAVAASGTSAWTCAWLQSAKSRGAVSIGLANNQDTELLRIAEFPIWLDSGVEVLAGSTRMASGTAQKVALNVFSTALMIRLNRTYGNLMVDMAAVNSKLDRRRIRLLRGVVPQVSEQQAAQALSESDGWIKLAVLVAVGESVESGRCLLDNCQGSLRVSLAAIGIKPGSVDTPGHDVRE